jgi:hypothetical protein
MRPTAYCLLFWCVVFLTLQPLLTWFRSFGLAVPLPSGGISTSWLALLESDTTSCHSERSEESPYFQKKTTAQILRFAQNDNDAGGL